LGKSQRHGRLPLTNPSIKIGDRPRFVKTWSVPIDRELERLLHQARPERRTQTRRGRPQGQTQELLASITEKPFQNPPPDEKPVGDLKAGYSRRINIRHRLVYEVLTAENTVKVLRMWSLYE